MSFCFLLLSIVGLDIFAPKTTNSPRFATAIPKLASRDVNSCAVIAVQSFLSAKSKGLKNVSPRVPNVC